jgi:hypothetical protein
MTNSWSEMMFLWIGSFLLTLALTLIIALSLPGSFPISKFYPTFANSRLKEMSNPELRPFTGNEADDLQAIKLLYEKYYAYLCTVAEHIVKNSPDAEEIVSDVFLKLWKLRNELVFFGFNQSLSHQSS